jgi:hypothetical protein
MDGPCRDWLGYGNGHEWSSGHGPRIMSHKDDGGSVKSPSARAFDNAIATGRLSIDPQSPRYAGLYMFMGAKSGNVPYGDSPDAFKHSITRRYLP